MDIGKDRKKGKMIKNLLNLLKQDKIEDAFKLSEQLRQSGTPITTLRHTVYEVFREYKIHNIPKAEEIVKVFGEDYRFRYWINKKEVEKEDVPR